MHTAGRYSAINPESGRRRVILIALPFVPLCEYVPRTMLRQNNNSSAVERAGTRRIDESLRINRRDATIDSSVSPMDLVRRRVSRRISGTKTERENGNISVAARSRSHLIVEYGNFGLLTRDGR